ncbi:hypothetical protein RHSIM_Rhsim12G0098000 [Rhododendron simsii]|uniref:Uncharacterized protein n=1 Tax=Rhododendron simsii TaxID=118357 RepID=A0A834G513_RHOSS|nr:hypothetical protein RHSIM_Rhsim12G0098000 [Rhododendron simsii]
MKEEKKLMEDDLPRKLEEAGDAGELKGIKDTHISSFLRGYQVGFDYAEVPEVDHRREPPVVPPVELQESLLPAEQLNPTTDSQSNPTDLAGV